MTNRHNVVGLTEGVGARKSRGAEGAGEQHGFVQQRNSHRIGVVPKKNQP